MNVRSEVNKWSKVKISQCLRVLYGRRQDEIKKEGGKYPILGTGGEMGRTDSYLMDKPSVLIGRKGTIDKPYYMDKPFWAIDTLFYTDIKSSAFPKYIYYIFQTINWRKYNEASGVPSLSVFVIHNISVHLPPLLDQKCIARLLGTWDKHIEKIDRKIELKRNIKKGLMQQIFSQKIRFKDRGGLDYPKWKDVSLNQVLEGGSKIAVKDNSKYKKITIKLHKKGIMFFAGARKMADTRPFYVRKEGEIIIGKQNYFNGSIAVVDDKHAGAICSNAIMSFCVNKGYSSNYIYEYISTDSFIRKREYLANGTGQKELSEKDFLNFKIKAPTYEEQKQIADFALYMDKATEVLETKRELADNVRKYLLNNLVSGKIRVPKNLGSKVKKENA